MNLGSVSLDDRTATRPDMPCDREATQHFRRNFPMEATTYLATDVAKSGLLAKGYRSRQVVQARSAGIAALLSLARVPKLQP